MRNAITPISAPILGGVVPPSTFRVRLPNRGGDSQLMSMQLVQQLGRTTLTLGKINTVDLQREPSAYHPWREDQVGKANTVIGSECRCVADRLTQVRQIVAEMRSVQASEGVSGVTPYMADAVTTKAQVRRDAEAREPTRHPLWRPPAGLRRDDGTRKNSALCVFDNQSSGQHLGGSHVHLQYARSDEKEWNRSATPALLGGRTRLHGD